MALTTSLPHYLQLWAPKLLEPLALLPVQQVVVQGGDRAVNLVLPFLFCMEAGGSRKAVGPSPRVHSPNLASAVSCRIFSYYGERRS